MLPSSTSPLLFPLLALLFIFPSPSHQMDQDPRLIDRIIRESAHHKVPKHRRTSVPYRIQLPSNLSGITAEVIRFRAGSLRRHGARIKEFRLNPGIVIHPRRRRLIVIHQNLGNCSYIYNQNISGYQLVSPVLGLLFYDTNYTKYPSELDVFIKAKPITVNFSELVVGDSDPDQSMCATFQLDGNVSLSILRDHNVCVAWQQGHFAIIRRESASNREKFTKWKVILISAIGVLGVVLLALVVVALVVNVKRKRSRMAELERRAYEDEALQMSMVGHVRAPTAVVARTAPAIEHEYNPSL